MLKKILLPILFLALLASCSKDNKQTTTTPTSTEKKIDSVEVVVAKMESVQKELTLPAELLPYERVQLYAKVPSYVREIKVDIGSRVQKGQVLATLDAPELTAKVAEVAANTRTALARLQNSQDLHHRLQAGRSSGAVSVREVEQAFNQLRADSAAFIASQEIMAAARQQQKYLVITAPFSGVITKRNADAGVLVGTSSSLPLIELENNATLRLRVAIPENLVGNSLNNNELNFKVKAIPNKVFSSKLTRKSDRIDAQTRSEIWEFAVPNSTHELKAGMFADAKLKFARPQSVITLPPSTVVTTLEKRFVIRVVNGTTEWIDVTQGTGAGEKVEVFGNLNEGDTIVKTGNEELKPDTKVIAKMPKQ